MLRERADAGLDALVKNELVDPKRIAAIGYCFGGTAVIELARSGARLNGVVSFHGGLDSPTPADGKNIKCKILALAGADDPFQKPEDLAAFEKRDARRKGGLADPFLRRRGSRVYPMNPATTIPQARRTTKPPTGARGRT